MPTPIMTDGQAANGEEIITPPDSSTENKTDGDTGASAGSDNQGDKGQGGQQQDDEFKDLPFHEHPRWKQREQEWNERFEKQEQQFKETLTQEIQKAIATNKPQAPNDANDNIPIWFGGGKDTPEVRKMWEEYKREQKRIITEAEKAAEDRVFSRLNEGQSAQEKAVADANKHFESSVNTIEATYGKRVDRNALLKYVLDNQIIDHASKRWDYLKGYRWMMAEAGTPVTAPKQGDQGGNRQDRKNLAGATGKDSNKGNDGSGKTVTTSEDFKDSSKRPW